MKWAGYLGLLLGVSFTVLLGLFSDSAYAVSDYDNVISHGEFGIETYEDQDYDKPVYKKFSEVEIVTMIREALGEQSAEYQAVTNPTHGKFMVQTSTTVNGIQFGHSIEIYVTVTPATALQANFVDYGGGDRALVSTGIDMYRITLTGALYLGTPNENGITVLSDNRNAGVEKTVAVNYREDIEYRGNNRPIMMANLSVNYPEGYAGKVIGTSPVGDISDWKPNIKLHQGSNWVVELSDYNFFTFDSVAFTCGEHELAPVIHWEVWDITDNDNRELIDTLIYGAPSLVTYKAPKIQVDKTYEIVAYYSDCEGFEFSESSTKQFTVREDGSLKPTDYMTVCILDEFPWINIPDCIAEMNDFMTVLSFRTPKVEDLGNPGGGGGGGGWGGLVEGCRQLQVLDEWILSPDVVICPKFPSHIRSIITPIVTFALALGVITFVVQRQGMRGISG